MTNYVLQIRVLLYFMDVVLFCSIEFIHLMRVEQ